MSSPSLTVLGVYRPAIAKRTWREQWQVTGDEEATQEHFRRLVLIEAIVEGLSTLKFANFGQMQPDHPNDRRYMQVGYWSLLRERQMSLDCITTLARSNE